MEFLADLWGYVRTHKKFCFLPLIIILFLAALFITTASVPSIAPFIYAMF